MRHWVASTSSSATPLAIGDDVEDRVARAKPHWPCTSRMGCQGRISTTARHPDTASARPPADRIQELYLAGRKQEAIAVVPDDLVRHVSLIGSAGFVRERMAAFAEAVSPRCSSVRSPTTPQSTVDFIAQLKNLTR